MDESLDFIAPYSSPVVNHNSNLQSTPLLANGHVRDDVENSTTFESNVKLTSSRNDEETALHKKYQRRRFGNSNRSRSKSVSFLHSAAQYDVSDIRRMRERLLRTNPVPTPAIVRRFSTTQRMTLGALALVDFICFCSMSIMAPFYPQEAENKGMTETQSGLVFSFYALVMFVSSPVFGKVLPQLGAKFLFTSGLFVSGVCSVLFGTLAYISDTTMFMTFCFLIRGMEALGASASSTASYVFVVSVFPNNMGSVLGLLETFVGLGMSMGPAIGGLLYSLGGFGLPFYFVGVLNVLVVPVTLCMLPPVLEPSASSHSPSLTSLLKLPVVIVTCLVIIVASSAWGFLDPTLEPHLRQFSLNSQQVGLIFLLFSGLYAIASPIWGWLADKVNNHWSMMFFGLVVCSGGLLMLGPSPLVPFLMSALWLNLLGLSLVGVAIALVILPTFQSILASALESGCSDSIATYSMVAGLWSSMYSLGEVLGPSMGGVLLEKYGFPICSTVMAVIALSLAISVLIFHTIRDLTRELIESGSSDSGTSEYSTLYGSTDSTECTTNTDQEPSEPATGSGHMQYTVEKVNYYEESRKNDQETGEIDKNQITDVRGTVNITSGGACEV